MSLPEFPPADPAHSYYLTTCYVCQELAKPGQEHIRNYGAIVCFSCRQFFRRAHQKTKTPNFVCTFGGNCIITIKTRRRCQKCRYDRCLFAGMIPSAVLTDEEKSVRFRKFRQKRKARRLALANGEIAPEAARASRRRNHRNSADNSSESHISDMDDEHLLLLNQDLEEIEVPHKRQRIMPPHQQPQTLCQLPLSVTPVTPTATAIRNKPIGASASEEPALPWAPLLTSKIETIVARYQMTLTQMQTGVTGELFLKFESIQMGDTSVHISKSDIFSHLVQVSKQFHHFALFHSQFNLLKKSDQRKLLARNTQLYIQLYLSFYFRSIPATEILHSLTAQHSSGAFKVRHTPFSMIFKSDSAVFEFAKLVARLRALRVDCAKVRAVLAHIVLFQNDKIIEGEDKCILEDLNILSEIMFMSCLKRGHEKFSMNDFISTLQNMADFSSKNINWKRNGECIASWDYLKARSSVSVSQKLSCDEKLWLADYLETTDEAIFSITRTEEFLKELAAFCVGAPPTVNYLVETWNFFKQRVWKLLCCHDQFQSLPEISRMKAWRQSGPIGVAYMTLRKECTNNGLDQLRDEFGGLSRRQFETLFRSLFTSPGKLKKRWCQKNLLHHLDGDFKNWRMADVVSVCGSDVLLWRELMEESASLKQKIKIYLQDPVLEKILLLLSLTQESSDVLSSLHNLHLTILWKYLLSHANNGDPLKVQILFSKILKTLSGLRRVSMYQSFLQDLSLLIKVEPF